MQEALSVIPLKTLQYFGMYFLNIPAQRIETIVKEELIDQLIDADKAIDALALYKEAEGYIIHHAKEYEFYLWYEQESSCSHTTIERVLELLDQQEYFGKATCVLLMECGEVAVANGILYALPQIK